MEQLQAHVGQREETEKSREKVLAELAERAEQLDRRRAELEQERTILEAQLQAWHQHQQQAAVDLARQYAELEQRQQEVAAQYEAGAGAGQESGAAQAGASLYGIQDEDAIFARLQNLSMLASESAAALPTEDEATEEASSAQEPVDEATEDPVEPEVVPTAADESDASAESDDEESIEQYMARLLKRVGSGRDHGGRKSHEPVQKRAEPQAPMPKAPAPRPAAEPAAPAETARPKPEKSLVELARRAAPPEVSELAAMRELANAQARAAIYNHGKRQSSRNALGKWGLAALTLATSMAAMIWSRPEDVITRCGALIALAIAAYWVYQAFVSTRQIVAEQQRELKQSQDAPAAAAPPAENAAPAKSQSRA